MIKFLPVIIYSAVSLAIYQGSFYPLFEMGMGKDIDPDEKTKRCTLADVGLGLGETVGGLLNGHMQDKVGFRKIIYLYLVEVTIAFGLIISYTLVNDWNLWYASGLTFFWGLIDSGANNFVWSVCGF